MIGCIDKQLKMNRVVRPMGRAVAGRADQASRAAQVQMAAFWPVFQHLGQIDAFGRVTTIMVKSHIFAKQRLNLIFEGCGFG